MVHLVATGPDEVEEAPRATGVVVSDLFLSAEKSVIVVGYAVHQGQKVFKDLADRMTQQPGLQVRLCLGIQRKDGDTSIPEEIVRRFSERFQSTQWPACRPLPEVYYDSRSVSLERKKVGALHAKCVVVDAQRLFISSANFTEAAQERNIEIGLLLDSCVLARRATDFIERLIQTDLLKRLL